MKVTPTFLYPIFGQETVPRRVPDVAWEQNYVNTISWKFLGLPPLLSVNLLMISFGQQ